MIMVLAIVSAVIIGLLFLGLILFFTVSVYCMTWEKCKKLEEDTQRVSNLLRFLESCHRDGVAIEQPLGGVITEWLLRKYKE